MKLDEFQQKFIDYRFKNNDVILLEANAGSGKTTTIVEKVKLLFDGNNQDQFVITTFANRMAGDIRRKLKQNNIVLPNVGTLHSICINFYRQYCSNKLVILNEWESIKIIRGILYDIGLKFQSKKEANKLSKTILDYIGFYNANMVDKETPLSNFFDNIDTIDNINFKKVQERYFSYKEEHNLYDFDDLVSDRLINQLPINKIREQTKYLFVDEAQDLNKNNHSTLKKLFSNSIMVYIYDLKQTLYSFRYAYTYLFTHSIDYFGKDKNIVKFNLFNNYRSSENIVNIFNQYAKMFGGDQSIPTLPNKKGSVVISKTETDTQVGIYVKNKIKELTNSGYKHKDITILVRKSSFIKSVIEPVMVSNNIPYINRTPQYKKKFFEVPINNLIMQSLNYLIDREKYNVYTVADLFIGIGASTKERLIKNPNFNLNSDPKLIVIRDFINHLDNINIKTYLDFKKLFLWLIKELNLFIKPTLYSEKLLSTSVKTFSNFIKILVEEEGITDPVSIIYEMSQRIIDYDADNKDAVEVTTIFQYKGKENKVILLTDMCDTQFEKNDSLYPIMYVGLSRSMDKLFVVDYDKKHTYKFGYIKVKRYPLWSDTLKEIIKSK